MLNGFTGEIVVTFDSPLQPAVLDSTNWAAAKNPNTRFITAAVAAGSAVALATSPDDPYSGDPFVSYTIPNTPDLYGLNGLPVADFNIPLS